MNELKPRQIYYNILKEACAVPLNQACSFQLKQNNPEQKNNRQLTCILISLQRYFKFSKEPQNKREDLKFSPCRKEVYPPCLFFVKATKGESSRGKSWQLICYTTWTTDSLHLMDFIHFLESSSAATVTYQMQMRTLNCILNFPH